MPQAAIVAVLRHIIGLNPEAIGPEVIARAVRHRAWSQQCSASRGLMTTWSRSVQCSASDL